MLKKMKIPKTREIAILFRNSEIPGNTTCAFAAPYGFMARKVQPAQILAGFSRVVDTGDFKSSASALGRGAATRAELFIIQN